MEDVEPAWRKSSYSGNGGADCVEVAAWRTCSHVGNDVEVAIAARVVLVRDTKDRDSEALTFSAGAWQALTTGLKWAGARK